MQRLEFYKLEKRYNSTKIPDGTTPKKVVTGYLREPSSTTSPTIKIDANFSFATGTPPFEWTYCYWVQANRYYFVKDWVWTEGIWEVHLTEDVLASFRTEIGNASEYILRTDTDGEEYNGQITDTTYPTTTEVETDVVAQANPFTDNINSGCFIVGIISGDTANSIGAITYYVMTSAQFGSLKDMLFSDSNLEVMGILDGQGLPLIQDMSAELLKTLYNPYQYIASCMFFPFPVSIFSSSEIANVSTIKIGWWTYNLSGARLCTSMIRAGENGIEFKEHPQAGDRGYYLNYEPYSKRYLIGRFGTVALDSLCFQLDDYITVQYDIDVVSGQCRTMIGRTRDEQFTLLAVRNFLLAVPIQLAQVGQDYIGTVTSAVKAVPAIMAGEAVGGVVGGTVGAFIGGAIGGASGIYNTIKSSMPILETSGTNGSFLGANLNTYCVTQFYTIVDEDLEHRGRPLCDIRTINTLSGFVQCADGELDISCYEEEKTAINRFLTNGFFWE